MNTYVCIDPGKKGGLVVLQDERVIDCRKMINDYAALFAFFRELQIRFSSKSHLYGIIEEVHSMPKQGVVSAFTFGQGYGALLMAMIATGFHIYQVTPQRWMKDLVLKKPKEWSKITWKKFLVDVAKQQFHNQSPTLETADALLIAQWVIEREQEGDVPWQQS